MGSAEKKSKSFLGAQANHPVYILPDDLREKTEAAVEQWRSKDKVRRFWARDASLWTNSDESRWMGWLELMKDRHAHIAHYRQIAQEIKHSGFVSVLLLGMGGSSLFPEVMKMTFGKIKEYPELFILDSTDPAQVRATEKKLNFPKTLFIVSSKSGSTLEPNVFMKYFFQRVKNELGIEKAGEHFIAITDPGSKLEQIAKNNRFRHIFFGIPSIGGRFSALSNFGMVPAAIMGVDVSGFLDRAEEMVHSCAASVAPKQNPGILLGITMGVLAACNRDKLTIITSPKIANFGAWLEQLIAESTGKDGKCIIPIDQELLGPPEVYGNDRFFVYIRLESEFDPKQDKATDILQMAGFPVIRLSIVDSYALAGEVFRWEVATAVAGSIMGINPFNQPDVEASKIATRKLTFEYETAGLFPEDTPILVEDGIKLFADEKNSGQLLDGIDNDKSLCGYLSAHLNRLTAGDYFAILAYVEMNSSLRKQLQSIRQMIRDAKRVSTTLGFGPRFLHSTGQAYKGGPNTGVFLQISCDDAEDVAIPQEAFSFGVVKLAQAQGDFKVLTRRNRRIVRIQLTNNVKQGLKKLQEVIKRSLLVKKNDYC